MGKKPIFTRVKDEESFQREREKKEADKKEYPKYSSDEQPDGSEPDQEKPKLAKRQQALSSTLKRPIRPEPPKEQELDGPIKQPSGKPTVWNPSEYESKVKEILDPEEKKKQDYRIIFPILVEKFGLPTGYYLSVLYDERRYLLKRHRLQSQAEAFFMEQDRMKEKSGLSFRVQKRARGKLIKLGVVKVLDRKGFRYKNYYILDFKRLFEFISPLISPKKPGKVKKP
jgi:hypothetical protein